MCKARKSATFLNKPPILTLEMFNIYIYLAIGAFALFFFAGIRIIRPTEKGLIERLGKYHKFANNGFNWIIPIVDRMIVVNITEKMVNVESQEIITSDKLNAKVDAQIYFKIRADEKNVKNSQYYVYNCENQIVNLARTTLRNIIGTMKLSDANGERNRINKDLMETLRTETADWGIEIVRAELKEINPPEDVQATMNKVVIAENEKTASIDFATARETEADGSRRAKIKEAEGEAQSIKLRAEAQAGAIKTINESAEKYFKGNAQLLKKLEVTEASLRNNSKIILTDKGITPTLLINSSDIEPNIAQIAAAKQKK